MNISHHLEDGEPKRGVTYRAPSGRLCRYSKPGPAGSMFFAYTDSKDDGFLASVEFFTRCLRPVQPIRVPE